MAIIQISTHELTNVVQDIRSINHALNETLSELSLHIRQLDQSWEGITYTTFLEKYLQLSQQFDTYQQIVESYGSHLEKILEQYRMTEQNLQMNAANFS